ncbi:recombinase family protein [Rothia sp. AR01]|uniref:Recombinase family protein n=1 Tax=Rothia santali TaxID=2949643 RepID=A0A9X2KHI4_9MICC|nr:recombinase family protein [Rothia santali]MCP3424824.1 recombinase family protein [Rothia santali]
MTSALVRAAVYLRISLDRNMDGLAIDRQRDACLRIAKDRGWAVVEEYVDQSKSATDKAKKRPDYDRMVADFAAGRFDAIICWDLDRLTRQPRQLEDWIDAAEDRGLQLVTANGEADLTTDGGRMYARIKAAVARGEVDRKSFRQSAGQLQRAEQGRAPKGTRPLGYTSRGEVIDHEAAAVRELYRLFAITNGPSIAALAAGLSGAVGAHVPNSIPSLPKHTRTLMIERNERRQEEGLEPKPVPEDGPWASSTVLGILRNPRYAGYSVYTDKKERTDRNKRRSWYSQILRDVDGRPVMGQWEALVDEMTWYAVQERLNDQTRVTNRTGSTARKHLGSSLYLCGICDQPIRAHSHAYRCPGHLVRSRANVDDWVLRIIRARLARPDVRDALSARDEPRLKALQDEVGVHEGRIMRAQNDYDEEIIEGRDLKRIRDRESAYIEALNKERRALTATTDLGGVLDAVDLVKAFDDADLAIKRRVIDFFCEVRLYPAPRGRKVFDPETVKVTPKGLKAEN